jgi:hypothetical protein
LSGFVLFNGLSFRYCLSSLSWFPHPSSVSSWVSDVHSFSVCLGYHLPVELLFAAASFVLFPGLECRFWMWRGWISSISNQRRGRAVVKLPLLSSLILHA